MPAPHQRTNGKVIRKRDRGIDTLFLRSRRLSVCFDLIGILAISHYTERWAANDWSHNRIARAKKRTRLTNREERQPGEGERATLNRTNMEPPLRGSLKSQADG